MLNRKINASVSLLTAVMLLAHAILLSVWMLSGERTIKPPGIIGWITMGLMLVHALISIDSAISAHSETKKRKGRKYPKMNISTIIQRASGVLMIPTAGFHIAGTVGSLQPPPIVHVIVPPLFFTIVLVHIAVSASKAFITLGIGSAKFVKAADIVIKVICGATLITGVIGIYLRTF
jgi:hypothetical protein